MRMFLGMFLGSALTVSAAFISDAASPLTGADQMVNWEIAGERIHAFAAMVHTKVGNLLGA